MCHPRSSATVWAGVVLQISPQDHLVSFDVTNLFTQIPITDTLKVIEEKLASDQSLESRTNVPVLHLVVLVELCLRSSYLQFQGSFYEQTDGAAMGSPLSPIIANLYLERLEEETISSAPLQPKLWRRYVGDTFFCFIKSITSRLDLTLYSAVDKDLRVETSCTIFWIIATCFSLGRFRWDHVAYAASSLAINVILRRIIYIEPLTAT